MTNRIKTIICLTGIIIGLHTPSAKLEAVQFSTDVGGCGYQQCRACPVLAPAVGLALITLAAIIALALQNTHQHAHSHCN